MHTHTYAHTLHTHTLIPDTDQDTYTHIYLLSLSPPLPLLTCIHIKCTHTNTYAHMLPAENNQLQDRNKPPPKQRKQKATTDQVLETATALVNGFRHGEQGAGQLVLRVPPQSVAWAPFTHLRVVI